MHHFRKTRQAYTKHNLEDKAAQKLCALCDAAKSESPIAESEHITIIPNRVAYDVFEGNRTTGEHYLIMPKSHRESFEEFTDQEKLDTMHLIAQFERDGFNVYARGKGNPNRSQAHQHTHLIKVIDKPAKFLFYSAKPYFVAHID